MNHLLLVSTTASTEPSINIYSNIHLGQVILNLSLSQSGGYLAVTFLKIKQIVCMEKAIFLFIRHSAYHQIKLKQHHTVLKSSTTYIYILTFHYYSQIHLVKIKKKVYECISVQSK